MTGRRQKSPDRLADRRPSRLQSVSRVEDLEVREIPVPPPPPAWDGGRLGAYALACWESFWRSPVAGVVDLDADLDALNEWVCAIDERVRIAPLIAAELVTEGSKGQQRLNPLIGYAQQLTRTIARAEEAFGMNPQARMRLGVRAATAGDVLERMMADLEALRPSSDHIPPEYLDD